MGLIRCPFAQETAQFHDEKLYFYTKDLLIKIILKLWTSFEDSDKICVVKI